MFIEILMVLAGISAGTAVVFVDRIAAVFYQKTLKGYLAAREESFSKGTKSILIIFLASMYYIVASAVILIPLAAIFVFARNVSGESVSPGYFKSFLPYTVVIGMTLGAVLRRRWHIGWVGA